MIVAKPLALAGTLACLALSASAQGSDDCATPQPISGTGLFPFDNTSATTGAQGQTNGVCFSFGTSAVDYDVWFSWTAPASGNVTFATCGLTSVDTKIAVHAGSSCPSGEPLACSEDACNYQSKLDFLAVAGASYLLQLGSYPSAPGGVGNFSLQYTDPAPHCFERTGPDVIAADILSAFNTTPEGSIDAIALGVAACNMGTVKLNWLGGSPDTALVRGNFHRYQVVDGAGRFEQIGLSWLKNGFYPAPTTTHCACTPEPPGVFALGPGCTDTYNATYNANQTYAYPNFEVSAATGLFPVPHANPPWSGTIARRLQLALDDLSPTGFGVRWFAEAMYVAADEAAAGNQDNNASWREMTVSVSGGDATVSVLSSGATSRGSPAIRAWKTVDPVVQVTQLSIPSDGFALVGWRVTQLAGGLWHYEYAVENLNSDRCIGAFSLPVADDVVLTNVGFHDVSYHSGDGPGGVEWSALDWTSTRANGRLTWACESEAQNTSANAIRWGTLYNFRFDANKPPQATLLELGLWMGGNPAAIATAAEGCSPATDNTGIAFCFGDGTLATACPCSPPNTVPNPPAAPGHGCANSQNLSGALLSATGTTAPDALAFNVSVSPNYVSFGLLLKGDASANGGIASADGVRCVDGQLIRFGAHFAGTNGAPQGYWTYPNTVQTNPVSVQTAQVPGQTSYYQLYYRNTAANFCNAATTNWSNGLRVVWP